MLRHLYREGTVALPSPPTLQALLSVRLTMAIDLDVKDLKTPGLCVRCWRLADYLQFETLKQVAMSSLQDHLDAMALLASCNGYTEGVQPNWLTYLLEAFREVCFDETTKPLHNTFAAFLLVTRFEVLTLPQTLDVLNDCHGLCQSLLKLFVWSAFEDQPTWIPNKVNIKVIQTTKRPTFTSAIYCEVCDEEIDPDSERVFWDPFPANPWAVNARSTWCESCAAKFSEECCWPWRSGRGMTGNKVKLEAWSWSDNE